VKRAVVLPRAMSDGRRRKKRGGRAANPRGRAAERNRPGQDPERQEESDARVEEVCRPRRQERDDEGLKGPLAARNDEAARVERVGAEASRLKHLLRKGEVGLLVVVRVEVAKA